MKVRNCKMTIGMKKLSSKTLKKVYNRHYQLLGCFNYERQMSTGYAWTMMPAIRELYGEDEAKMKAGVKRHLEFFNCATTPSPFIIGITCAMEEQCASAPDGEFDVASINSVKAALMGPLAGIGDSFFFNCYRVIIAGLCIGLSANGSLLGVILFVLLYGCLLLVYKYIFLTAGYRYGTSLITEAFERGIVPLITEAAGILGAIMVGALIAQNVSIKIALQPVIGGATIDFQGMLDSIMPGLLSLLLWGWSFSRVQKGWSPTKLIFMIMGACVVLAFFGIL